MGDSGKPIQAFTLRIDEVDLLTLYRTLTAAEREKMRSAIREHLGLSGATPSPKRQREDEAG